METLYFVAGLPRSGSTLIINLLKQNPSIHGEAVSSLSSIFSSIHACWNDIEANKEYANEQAKINVLKGVLNNYHSHINKPIIFDKDRSWISKIGLLEAILEKQVKILCPVRNPAEILASFEKIRLNNPKTICLPDQTLRERSTIASRTYFYAGPEGCLGMAHAHTLDAVTGGYLNRLLFVDYNKFCNSPKYQMKRIYEFFELPEFTHDFENIKQDEEYKFIGLPDLHKIKPTLEKTTINCVQYLGLNLYEQYNREIFWNAWI